MAVGENRYFREALADFVQETAYGNAVRYTADRGYTVAQIMERLEYPAPCEKVRRMVWKHLEDNGVILREEPGSGRHRERFSYVKEYDRNGLGGLEEIACFLNRDYLNGLVKEALDKGGFKTPGLL